MCCLIYIFFLFCCLIRVIRVFIVLYVSYVAFICSICFYVCLYFILKTAHAYSQHGSVTARVQKLLA